MQLDSVRCLKQLEMPAIATTGLRLAAGGREKAATEIHPREYYPISAAHFYLSPSFAFTSDFLRMRKGVEKQSAFHLSSLPHPAM